MKLESIQNPVASYGKTFQAIETGVENEYENVDILVECNQVSSNRILWRNIIPHIIKINNTPLQPIIPFEGDEKLKIKNINNYASIYQ